MPALPTVRPATRADADAVFALATVLATSARPERAAFDRSFTDVLVDPSQRLLVAEQASAVIGYLHGLVHPAFHANGEVAWIEEVIVDEVARGQGLGRQLVAAFDGWARQTHRATYLSVATRRADGFYRSLGFTESASYFRRDG